MKDPGIFIRKYGSSRSLILACVGLSAVFGAAGAFVLSLIPRIGTSLQFNGDVSILYGVGFGGLAIAGLIIVVSTIAIRAQPSFYLHEKGIRAVGKNLDRTDLFEEITDLFMYYYGGFGYRSSQNSAWVFSGGRSSGLWELTAKFREQHVKYRGERLFQEILNGNTVTFRHISNKHALSKSLFATRKLDYPTSEIELTRDRLRMDGRAIPVMQIADMRTNLWTETAKVVDIDDNAIFKVHFSAFMSFDVLCDLIVRLQQHEMKMSQESAVEL